MNSFSISKFILSLFVCILFTTKASAQAPNREYADVIADLTDIIRIGSQAQGKAQQVATFATVGDLNKMRDGIYDLNGDLEQISQLWVRATNRPIRDRIIYFQLANQVNLWETGKRAWTAASTGSALEVAQAAEDLRVFLHVANNGTTEIRVALCCVMI